MALSPQYTMKMAVCEAICMPAMICDMNIFYVTLPLKSCSSSFPPLYIKAHPFTMKDYNKLSKAMLLAAATKKGRL